MIDRARWQQLSALLDQALELTAADRTGWLAQLQAQDPLLAAELAPMLAQADEDSGETTQPLPVAARFGQLLGQALQTPVASPPAPPPRLGPWRLLHLIGAGGMGQVWLAERDDGLYQARAAIKLLRSDLDAAQLSQRFARERSVLARLNHPAVARLLDAGVEQGQAYLVLEHVDGVPLGVHAREHCPLVAQRVRLLLQIAQAVEHAHAQLIVHRDLKPSNVLVTHQGQAKLLDFGIAGLLDDGEPVNSELTRLTGRGLTIGYAAPEQMLGEPIGTAADVFSLGVMLFELLTGELPFGDRNSGRLAMEHAVLHDEPRRLAAVLAKPSGSTTTEPGRPQDAERARGDLAAIVAKALLKDPAQRYGSVRALTDDLQAWLGHRPVSARREDWRRRTQLWLRRNAVLAGGLAAVGVTLSVGLAAATWQGHKAQAAARQSERIAAYLTDLLGSASPERHGGQVPNVLQLLEASRASLPESFRDDPDTRMRLLQVLGDTYYRLNRLDIAIPLFDELAQMAVQRFGAEDKRTLQFRWEQARVLQVQGLFDRAIQVLEPLQGAYAKAFGAESEDMRKQLYVLSTSYVRVGRLDEGDRLLGQAGRLTEANYAPGSPEWLSHQNHVQVLRAGQGRFVEALAALRRTEPYWGDPRPENQREILVFRRNTITIGIRLGEYEGVEERTQALLADMLRFYGPGADIAAGMRQELARYYTETGQSAKALALRDEIVANARSAKVQLPAVVLPARAQALLARAQAGAAAPDRLVEQARALLAEAAQLGSQLGYGRTELWLAMARVGVLLDDPRLAADALGALRADTSLNLARDLLLASRTAHLEGQLARLQGDLVRSREQLTHRMKVFERPGQPRDRQTLPAWSAALDLAYTAVLKGDADAASLLAAANARRPTTMPAGQRLDALAEELAQRLQRGDTGKPARGLGSYAGALL
jgi:eukaryotic-like serine/threonine-protein kinase